MEEENKICNPYHTVKGIVPDTYHLQFDKMICDCGRMEYYTETCGCPGNPKPELKSKPKE